MSSWVLVWVYMSIFISMLTKHALALARARARSLSLTICLCLSLSPLALSLPPTHNHLLAHNHSVTRTNLTFSPARQIQPQSPRMPQMVEMGMPGARMQHMPQVHPHPQTRTHSRARTQTHTNTHTHIAKDGWVEYTCLLMIHILHSYRGRRYVYH